MTNRERELRTLSFEQFEGRGSVEETFYPWNLTVNRFIKEGLPENIGKRAVNMAIDEIDITRKILEHNEKNEINLNEKYFQINWGQGVLEYEEYLNFDSVRRINFLLPFRRFEEKLVKETDSYIIRQDTFGRLMKRDKNRDTEVEYKPVIKNMDDWEKLKIHGDKEIELYYCDEMIQQSFMPLKKGHDVGDYSIRLHLEGFFWVPRELLGIESHLLAFYDSPELLHDICKYIFKIYSQYLVKVIEIIQPDVIYFMEDLSGKNGPMISGEAFDEFVGTNYKNLLPILKQKGVANVFVDTDGDFSKIIPNFLEAGVDGFLPMDVNAGMDIVKIRKEYPELKFIGGFNKLCIEKGKEAIDKEFERIMPVIKGGGFIPGADHQVTPDTSLENYKYYIKKLTEVMKFAK